jgi:hypothetical protein
MANAIKRFYTGQPSTTFTTLYTVDATPGIIIKDIIACNTSTSAAVKLDLCLVPVFNSSAGTAGSSNAILWDSTFATGETKILSIAGILDSTSDTIQAKADTASAMTVNISGLKVT